MKTNLSITNFLALLLASILACVLPARSYAQAGSVDTSFNPGSGADGFDVYSVVVQGDGKIILGGAFTTINGVGRNFIARLNSEGSLDTGFNPGGGADASVNSVVVQSDGKIILGGYFTSINGVVRNRIARLNADGSLDAGFNPGGGANLDVYCVAVQGDGKIILGGAFTTVNGVTRRGIARLNADGSLDAGFDPGYEANGFSVNSVVVQSDGKIILGGYFGVGIARLNADGSADTSFNAGSGADGSVNSVAVQSDGKIVLGGDFTSINRVAARNGVARLNADGSLDAGFNLGSGVDGFGIYSVALQGDGKIILGGDFTSINGVVRKSIARLNSDGSLDTGFNPGSGVSGGVNVVAVQGDGKIILGGYFTTVNGVARRDIARLNGDPSTHPAFFTGEAALSNGVFYLAFASTGNPFGYYSYLSDPKYVYHFDLGYEYVFDAQDGKNGVYLYDFKSQTFFYTAPAFPFPYLYDFSLNTVLYYYPDPNNPGHYNTNGTRYFYRFDTGRIITK